MLVPLLFSSQIDDLRFSSWGVYFFGFDISWFLQETNRVLVGMTGFSRVSSCGGDFVWFSITQFLPGTNRVLVGMIGFSQVSSCGVTLFDLASFGSSQEPKGFSGYNWVLVGHGYFWFWKIYYFSAVLILIIKKSENIWLVVFSRDFFVMLTNAFIKVNKVHIFMVKI